MIERKYEDGAYIIKFGDTGEEYFILKEGKVEVEDFSEEVDTSFE